MRNLLRRRSIGACMAVLAVGVLAGGCDSAQFAGGYSHTGDSNGEVFITPANVSTMTSTFSTVPLSLNGEDFIAGQATIVDGVMYVVGADGNLYAYDASGSNNCSGTPTTCAPLWKASLGGAYGANDTTPAVANGVVYVTSNTATSASTATIYAFDAAGKTDCSGSPTVCAPLWTAGVNTTTGGNLTVANGMLYALSGGVMEVFDANGTVDCSGTPKICSPIWTTTDVGGGNTVTISGGVAYMMGGTGTTVYAFDAGGHTNCSGTPAVCSPLRTYTTQYLSAGIPVVSGSTLYVNTYEISGTPRNATLNGGLEAFDATGSTNCSGTAVVCTPLWLSSSTYASQEPPVVANGDVYVAAGSIAAFAANGTTGCSGTPKVCSPLWTTSAGGGGSLTVGGSVLYDTLSGHALYAFDATGVNGCTNAVCSPLWSRTNLGGSSSILPGPWTSIANDGTLYVSAFAETQNGSQIVIGGLVDAFRVP